VGTRKLQPQPNGGMARGCTVLCFTKLANKKCLLMWSSRLPHHVAAAVPTYRW